MFPPLAIVRGRAPIVLVAPHAGRRDPARRPWGREALKMNDLHTGAVAHALAARLGASALVNETGDRNDVDLNRLSAAHDAAPHFLDALGDLVAEGLARHARLSLLVIHGWNVVQPAVDVGLGVSPALGVRGGGASAVSEAFAARVLPRLAARLDAAGIATTPGLRYPARARENLLQAFTTRYVDDPRPAIGRLARLADRVDAVQLELSLPVRLPGPWRDAFLDACVAALAPDDGEPAAPWSVPPAAAAAEAIALELAAPGLYGLASLDAQGGRLLLFTDDGRLFTFTGERAGGGEPDRVGGLRLVATGSGGLELSYDGPMLAFPDTTPFTDLERGLATAHAVTARVRLRQTPAHADDGEPCPVGAIDGHATVDGATLAVAGHGVRGRRDLGLAAHPRATLRFADGSAVIARGDAGFVCRRGAHVALGRVAVTADEATAHIAAVGDDGSRVETDVRLVHRLPVVPGVPGAPRILFAACRDRDGGAGWLTLRSG